MHYFIPTLRNLSIAIVLILPLLFCACTKGGSSNGGSSDSGTSRDACGAIGLPTKVINGRACGDIDNAAIIRVAAVISSPTGPVTIPICTGTLVSPTSVLTATHCFDSSISGVQFSGAGILIGERDSARYIAANNVSYLPGYSFNGERVFNDLAIMTLATDAGLPVIPLLASRTPRTEESVLVYGYGQREPGDNPSSDSIDFSDLVSGEMRLETVTPNHLFVAFSGSGTNVCKGDSGGPMIQLFGGTPTILGVVSQGSNSTCKAGDVTTFTNATAASVISFILETAPDASLF